MQNYSIDHPLPSDLSTVEQFIAAGYAALAGGDQQRAEMLFRQAVQTDPQAAQAWRALADTQTGARQRMCWRWVEYIEAAEPAPKPAVQRSAPVQPRPYRVRLIGAAGAAALALIVFGSDVVYRERVLPGVHVGAINVGHLRAEAVAATIKQHQQRALARLLEVRVGTQTWRAPMNTLLHNDVAAWTKATLAYGHEQAFWSRTGTRMRALLGQTHRIDTALVNEQAVKAFVASIADEISRERRDARVLRMEQSWISFPEQTGASIDQAGLIAEISTLLARGAWQAEAGPQALTAAVRYEAPTRTTAQIEPLRQRLQALAAQPLTARIGDQQWIMDRSMLFDLSTVIDPATLAPSPAAIARQLEPIAAQIAVAAQPSYLERAGDRIRTIVPGTVGRELDRDAAIEAIRAALSSNAAQVSLPVREIQPPAGEAEQLGLVAELGRGESQFITYSSPERDANVQAGGNDVDGVLIAPGETFSFTQAVGEITWEKGYRWGEMIEAGVIVPSLGGGICQVSTTVFRAAFWSGLEIVERHNHTWRLPWYEVDAPPGMDATIALGGPDLKIRNNTNHHILLQVETDLAAKRQTVIIYGTPDGRQVEMEALTTGNIGVRRHVLQGTQLLGEDTFVSYYTQ
jgi:vancomycin resistance protein YoaR